MPLGCGLSPCLLSALFGVAEPAEELRLVPPPPHIACVGCRLGARIAELDAFVARHAATTSPAHLWRLAADLYAQRVRPRLGEDAPEWTHDSVQRHYEHCCLDARLTHVAICRELRGIREMLLATLWKAEAGGTVAPPTFDLYLRVSALEASQHALLQRLGAPSKPAPALTPLVRTVAPAQAPLASLAALPPGGAASADDAASEASTTRAQLDAAAAEAWLRGALAEWIEPCTPPTAASSVQPTLAEVVKRADQADVISADRQRQLVAFQAAKAGRRCFCSSRRSGEACCVRLDQASLERLVENAPVGFCETYSDATALRTAIQDILRLPKGPILTRRPYPSFTLFGFRYRKQRS